MGRLHGSPNPKDANQDKKDNSAAEANEEEGSVVDAGEQSVHLADEQDHDADGDDYEELAEAEPPSLAKLTIALYAHNAALQAGKLLGLIGIVLTSSTLFVLLFVVADLPLVSALAITAGVNMLAALILCLTSVKRLPQTEQQLKREYEFIAEAAEKYRQEHGDIDSDDLERSISAAAGTLLGGPQGSLFAQVAPQIFATRPRSGSRGRMRPRVDSRDGANAAEEGRAKVPHQESPRIRDSPSSVDTMLAPSLRTRRPSLTQMDGASDAGSPSWSRKARAEPRSKEGSTQQLPIASSESLIAPSK